MRYRAEMDCDPIAAFEGKRCASAKVRASTWAKLPARAFRHARAMAAVIRAAKAWTKAATALESAYDRDERVSAGAPLVVAHLDMCSRLMRATARLVAVEKEVERGK